MRVELHPCYILHSRQYRETSLILDVFSVEHGRLSVIAKGGRAEKSGKRALMQLGREVSMAWSIRREMGTLTAIEPAGRPEPGRVAPSGGFLLAVFYMNELLLRLLHRHEPHADLFQAYRHALRALAERQAGGNGRDRGNGHAAESAEAVLRVFEKRLLESLGYGLLLEADGDGKAIAAERYYTYRPDTGPVPCPREQDASVAVGAGAGRYSGKTLLALAQEALSEPACLREAKTLMRAMLAERLGDRQLASRELYRSYLRAAAPERV